jgi:hypothetical protein
MVVGYQCFGTIYRSHLQGSSIGTTDFPQASVHNYQSTLRNIPGKQRSHLYSGGSLKSRIIIMFDAINGLAHDEVNIIFIR